ncbi:hypothetical protein IFM89_039211 [Coptis chinensis]|uniref:Uncharacterized protein n=1 Tax=Coptis chinensis TaxID=261450 RepID=A0A835LU33_9MAGN|nr:hypothetical protein IFM89_039211 [Coptis chinensis]
MSPINKKTGQKIKPDLNQEATKIINLKVLQRIDPSIEEILITAGHVTFYKFNIDKNEWSRRDVEGSLFVVKRILRAYSKVPPKLKVSSTKRDLNLFGTDDGEIDFEESETVRKNVMEVLLESPSSNSTAPNIANAPEDSSFLKFFNTATSITNASNAANPGQYQPPAVIPPSFRSPNVPTTVPALEIPYAP